MRTAGRSSRTRGGALLVVVALAFAAAGCGDGGGDPTAELRVKPARESAHVFLERLTKLLETTRDKADCTDIHVISARSFVKFRCPPTRALARSMKEFEVTGIGEYGMAAVVDYESGAAPDGGSVLLYVDGNRHWAVSRFGVLTGKTVGTDDAGHRDGYAQAAKNWVDAVRARDCAALERLVLDVPDGWKGRECAQLKSTTRDLARRLERDPQAGPEYVGGNGRYGFLALETARPKPRNLTIAVFREGDGTEASYKVVNAAPSLTTRALARAQRELDESRRDLTTPTGSMAPSNEPSE